MIARGQIEFANLRDGNIHIALPRHRVDWPDKAIAVRQNFQYALAVSAVPGIQHLLNGAVHRVIRALVSHHAGALMRAFHAKAISLLIDRAFIPFLLTIVHGFFLLWQNFLRLIAALLFRQAVRRCARFRFGFGRPSPALCRRSGLLFRQGFQQNRAFHHLFHKLCFAETVYLFYPHGSGKLTKLRQILFHIIVIGHHNGPPKG